jgi:hypothetical protein
MEPSPPLAELIGMLRDGCSSVEEEGKILEQLLKLSHKSANAAAMVANGLLAPLVALLQRGPQQNRAASAAILMNVSTNSERQAKIIQAGALVALVGLLWAGNDAARAYAAGALMNLATSVDAQLMMVERGAVEALVDMLSKRSVLGRMNAAGALRNIAASNRKNKEVIVWNGALEPLVNVLRSSNYLARSNAVRERGPRVVGWMLYSGCRCAWHGSRSGTRSRIWFDGVRRSACPHDVAPTRVVRWRSPPVRPAVACTVAATRMSRLGHAVLVVAGGRADEPRVHVDAAEPDRQVRAQNQPATRRRAATTQEPTAPASRMCAAAGWSPHGSPHALPPFWPRGPPRAASAPPSRCCTCCMPRPRPTTSPLTEQPSRRGASTRRRCCASLLEGRLTPR